MYQPILLSTNTRLTEVDMATKMNWDWISDGKGNRFAVKCIIYTTYTGYMAYKVRIMLGEKNNSPQDQATISGKVENCHSHMTAFHAGLKRAKRYVKETTCQP
jgi:hypothetical protein